MKRLNLSILLITMVVSCFLSAEASAFGDWIGGQVTRGPWSEQRYQYVGIDRVRYTIMPGSKALFAYQSEGAMYKDPIRVESLRVGDTVVAKVQGNRIYQIEKTQ